MAEVNGFFFVAFGSMLRTSPSPADAEASRDSVPSTGQSALSLWALNLICMPLAMDPHTSSSTQQTEAVQKFACKVCVLMGHGPMTAYWNT